MGDTLPEDTTFDWDEYNTSHIKRHNVTPEEVEEIFYQEPQVISADTKHSEKEKRYTMLGQTKDKRLLNIIFTLRGKKGEKIRIISARDQSKKERREYEKA